MSNPDPHHLNAPLARVHSGVFGAIAGLGMGIVIFGCVIFGRGSVALATTVGLVGGLSMGIGFTISAAWTKRAYRREKVPLNQRIGQAVLAGRLPASVDPQEWIPVLDRSRRFYKAITVSSLIMFPALAIMTIFQVIANPGEWRPWVQLTIYAGFAVFSPVQGRLQLRRIETIRAQLPSPLSP